MCGGYFSIAALQQRLIRMPAHLHVASLASSGVPVEFEIDYFCRTVQQLEKGCVTEMLLKQHDGSTSLEPVSGKQKLFYARRQNIHMCCSAAFYLLPRIFPVAQCCAVSERQFARCVNGYRLSLHHHHTL